MLVRGPSSQSKRWAPCLAKRADDTLGFTLIELLVTISIIAILTVLLFPVAGRMVESANSAKCVGNLRKIVTAFPLYAGENNGQLPPYGQFGNAERSWWQLISPYLGDDEENELYPGINHLRCPSQKDPEKWATYGVNYTYDNTVFGYEQGSSEAEFNGSARLSTLSPNALLIADFVSPYMESSIYSPYFPNWRLDSDEDGDGIEDSCSAFGAPYNRLDIRHGKFANGAFADGSVRRISSKSWGENENGMWGGRVE